MVALCPGLWRVFRGGQDNGTIAGTDSTGPVGGAFSPSSQTYTLRNTGVSSLNWSAYNNANWIAMSPNNGTLGAGNSTSTNVVIGASANSLSQGLHEAEIVFSNLSSGQSITREVRLSAIASPQTIQFFDLNSNPGWTTGGAWAYGVPQGLGSFGGDPASGKTGTKVYGYNLSGDYTNNLGDTNLTTGAVDCRGYVGVSLTFWRWLGIESGNADGARLQVSNDGATWFQLWKNDVAAFNDGQWVERTYDISAIADNRATVYIRWIMGPTNASNTRPGWNIDDVTLAGTPTANDVWVDFAYGGTEVGTPVQPFNTLAEAVAALSGSGSETVRIKGYTADNDSLESVIIDKAATVAAINGTVRIEGVP